MATTSAPSPQIHGSDNLSREAAMSAILARNWWAVAIRGAFAVLFGLIALFCPGATLLSLALFFAAYMLVDGVFGIVAAIRAAVQHQRWGLLLLEGALNIVDGPDRGFCGPVGAVLFFVSSRPSGRSSPAS